MTVYSFDILQSVVPCLVLPVVSHLAYGFIRRQVVWYSHLFKNFPHFVVIDSLCMTFTLFNHLLLDT